MVLPKEMRIKGYKCFDYIHKSSRRYKSSSMILKVTKAKNTLLTGDNLGSIGKSCRCAISISNKVSKKAVVRNRLRRLLHNHLRFRLFYKPNLCNYWALISLTPNCIHKDSASLLAECDKLFADAGFC